MILSLQFLVPGMEEIHRVKVQLPERTEPIPFPEIVMALKMESSNSKWTVVEVNKLELSNSTDLRGVSTKRLKACDGFS